MLDQDKKPTTRSEVVGAIEDPTVRGMVRLAVHVRGYAPYYVATLALFAFLAFGPRPDAGDAPLAQGESASAPLDGAAAAGGGGAGRTGATGVSATTAGTLIAGAAGAGALPESMVTGGGDFAVAGDTAGSGTDLPGTPDAPEVPDFGDDLDYGLPEKPDVCTFQLPSPAPAVAPAKEVDTAQGTVEAVAGVEAPADAAPYVDDAMTTAGCPDTSALPVPEVPLPGLPI